MDTNYILPIDPGLSSGVALIGYNDERVWLEEAWQFGGGVKGLIDWNWEHTYDYIEGPTSFVINPPWNIDTRHDFGDDFDFNWTEDPTLTIITEKFTARNTQGFSYRTDALEPLRCEGALIALGLMPDYTVAEKRWRDPSVQYLVGGNGKADKKKRQHKFLKDSGFYRTGKDLGTPDADDFRSAAAHGLAYLARELKHKPTFELMTEWVENNG